MEHTARTRIVRCTQDVDSYGNRPPARYEVTCFACGGVVGGDLTFDRAAELEALHVACWVDQ